MIDEDFKLQYQRERDVSAYVNNYQNRTFDAAKFSGDLYVRKLSVVPLTDDQMLEYVVQENKKRRNKKQRQAAIVYLKKSIKKRGKYNKSK